MCLNMLDAQHGIMGFQAALGEKSRHVHLFALAVLPCLGVRADDFAGQFEFGQIGQAVVLLPGFVAEYHIQHRHAGGGVAQGADFV